jgi:AraC-like DNA-binding protein
MIDMGELLVGYVVGNRQPSHVPPVRRRVSGPGVRWVWAPGVGGGHYRGRVPSPPPSPVDGFRAHVARATGDDDPATSRFRRALAGESTARFADRIVLERAAYLVRTTARTLEDIARESGFRGYDVFARAFRREYGELPSAWRAAPTSHVIDAPGEVHFQPPGALRLPARSRMDSVDLVVEMVEHHVRTVGDLVDAAARLAGPADTTLRSALGELVARMERLVALVHESPYDTGVGDDSLRARLDRVGPDYVAAVALLGASGRFDEAVVDAFSPAPATTTFAAMVTSAITDVDDLLRTARSRLAEVTA